MLNFYEIHLLIDMQVENCRFNIACILLSQSFLPTASMKEPSKMVLLLMSDNQLALTFLGQYQIVQCFSMSRYLFVYQ